MKKHTKFLAGLAVGAAAWLTIAATQRSDVPLPFKVGAFVQFYVENDKTELGNVISITGKWVQLETIPANGGARYVRWVNLDYVRTISFPAGTPAASK